MLQNRETCVRPENCKTGKCGLNRKKGVSKCGLIVRRNKKTVPPVKEVKTTWDVCVGLTGEKCKEIIKIMKPDCKISFSSQIYKFSVLCIVVNENGIVATAPSAYQPECLLQFFSRIFDFCFSFNFTRY